MTNQITPTTTIIESTISWESTSGPNLADDDSLLCECGNACTPQCSCPCHWAHLPEAAQAAPQGFDGELAQAALTGPVLVFNEHCPVNSEECVFTHFADGTLLILELTTYWSAPDAAHGTTEAYWRLRIAREGQRYDTGMYLEYTHR